MPTSKFSPDKLRAEVNPEGGFATNERYQVIFSNIPSNIDPDSKTNKRLQSIFSRFLQKRSFRVQNRANSQKIAS